MKTDDTDKTIYFGVGVAEGKVILIATSEFGNYQYKFSPAMAKLYANMMIEVADSLIEEKETSEDEENEVDE